MLIQDKTATELTTSFDGSIDRIDVCNTGTVTILASTPRGKTRKITLQEWEVSQIVKQLKEARLL